jgi:capsular polysaccharide biosynthesis protein
MEQFENEVELIEYLNVLWKRRWLIIVPTILLALVAGVVSFLIPPKWEIDAIIQPGKYFVQSAPGTFTEVMVTDPKQLVGQINQGSYIHLTSAELNLGPRKFPNIKADNPRDTKLVRVSLRTGETDKARAILNALFQHIKSDLDRKIDAEIMSITAQIALKGENDIKAKEFDIQSLNIEIEKTRQGIIAAGNKLKISEERSRSLLEEMKGVKARIDGIEKQQKTMLAEKQEGVETLGLLLYSNEIQQNFLYYNTLEENFSKEKNTQEDLRLSVREKEQVIKGFKTQIDKISQMIVALRSDMELLNEKLQRIDYTQLVKEPTVSPSPVSPRKKVNVAIAGFLGLFCFSILALFLDYVEKRNIRLKTGS